jgi:hypothetical protein
VTAWPTRGFARKRSGLPETFRRIVGQNSSASVVRLFVGLFWFGLLFLFDLGVFHLLLLLQLLLLLVVLLLHLLKLLLLLSLDLMLLFFIRLLLLHLLLNLLLIGELFLLQFLALLILFLLKLLSLLLMLLLELRSNRCLRRADRPRVRRTILIDMRAGGFVVWNSLLRISGRIPGSGLLRVYNRRPIRVVLRLSLTIGVTGHRTVYVRRPHGCCRG